MIYASQFIQNIYANSDCFLALVTTERTQSFTWNNCVPSTKTFQRKLSSENGSRQTEIIRMEITCPVALVGVRDSVLLRGRECAS